MTPQKTDFPPISLHPENPHYYLFRGAPTILISTSELYGAVLNLGFDYVQYLDALAAGGMNYTRQYGGAYFEPENKWFANQSLGPTPEQLCLPWGRSNISGYVKGGNLFDLDTWNPLYFARLRDFIAQAGARGIVVEFCLYNCNKKWTWYYHPLYHEWNINDVGYVQHVDFQTMKEPKLVAYQKAYVRKLTEAVNEFDNVILEIIDEPTISGALGSETTPWISAMVDTIIETESRLPNKHLIAQQVEGGAPQGPVDFTSGTKSKTPSPPRAWRPGSLSSAAAEALTSSTASIPPLTPRRAIRTRPR